MKKIYKILIIIGAIIAIATPSIWLGVYFYAQNRVNNTDVAIENFVISELTNETLGGTVNFSILNPTTVDASFSVTEFNLTYNEMIVGTGEILTATFSTKEENQLADFTLDITNTAAFDALIVDFTNLVSLDISIDVTIEFQGALASLPEKSVSKTITMNGLGSMEITLDEIEIYGTSADTLSFHFHVLVSNPTPVTANLSYIYADIMSENYIPIGVFIYGSELQVRTGGNVIDSYVTFNGPKEELSEILSKYISGVDQTFYLNYSLTTANLNGYIIQNNLTVVDFPPAGVDLVEIDVEMITLSVSAPATVSYEIDTIVTINNPVDFSINVTAFNGTLEYDDNDDSSFPLVGSYSAKDDIFLSIVNLNWSSSNLVLPALGQDSDTYTFSGSDVEQGVRLYDEYYTDNDLHVDIVDAIVYLKIGEFEIEVSITIEDIFVDSSS